MKYYVMRKHSGKCGCSSITWTIMEADSKAAIRRCYKGGWGGTVKLIYSETEVENLPQKERDVILSRAI